MINLISRRNFLKETSMYGAGVSLFGMTLSSCSETIQNSAYLDTIGLQLWTVRNQLAEDPVKTLEAVKAWGQISIRGSLAPSLVMLEKTIQFVRV